MKYRQLTQQQRYQIYALKVIGYTQVLIAKMVGVSKSTISREIKRNGGTKYNPKLAHEKTLERRKIARRERVLLNPELAKFVVQKLIEGWSPEQIAGYSKKHGIMQISHETIYRYIKEDKANGGSLYKLLRHAKKKRKNRGVSSKKGQIKDRVCISQRPQIVDEKKRIGDWEIDTVIGKNHKGVLVTFVERASKLTLIVKSANKRAESVTQAIIKMLSPIRDMVHTITVDNGKEFAWHKKVAFALNASVYFAHPYCSWERGLNENTNGLIRQYFPKKSSLDQVTEREIIDVMIKLNFRPRRTLGYALPVEAFFNGRAGRRY